MPSVLAQANVANEAKVVWQLHAVNGLLRDEPGKKSAQGNVVAVCAGVQKLAHFRRRVGREAVKDNAGQPGRSLPRGRLFEEARDNVRLRVDFNDPAACGVLVRLELLVARDVAPRRAVRVEVVDHQAQVKLGGIEEHVARHDQDVLLGVAAPQRQLQVR